MDKCQDLPSDSSFLMKVIQSMNVLQIQLDDCECECSGPDLEVGVQGVG